MLDPAGQLTASLLPLPPDDHPVTGSGARFKAPARGEFKRPSVARKGRAVSSFRQRDDDPSDAPLMPHQEHAARPHSEHWIYTF